MRTLKEVQAGDTVTVVKFMGAGPLRRRLMDMGLTRGTSVYVRKVAPLGDPIEVRVRGYELSLRKSEAEGIVVDAVPAEAGQQTGAGEGSR
jgi:ferrous iron transport protein A